MAQRKGPTPKKRRLKLAVIPEPEPDTRTVLFQPPETPTGTVFFRSDAAPQLIMECGSCAADLMRGVAVSQVRGVVLKCPGCGAFNEVLGGT